MAMHFKFILCIFAFANLFSHARSQRQRGFTSIDCGLPPESHDYSDTETGIVYSSDHDLYIDTGMNATIDPKYTDDSVDRRLRTVRYFPRDRGDKSCYNLTSLEGKSKRYLIRATFRYGNYDGRNHPPRFDLYLGADFWDAVELNDSTSVVVKEIVHAPPSKYLYVCLVDTGAGTPFISALELRLLNPKAYQTKTASESLASVSRRNFAPAGDGVVRYPDDIYDRLWWPYASPADWLQLKTESPVDVEVDYLHPPMAVMQSAVSPRNPNQSLQLFWDPPDPNAEYYVYLHFAEVVNLRSDEYRRLYINLNGVRWRLEAVVPSNFTAFSVFSTEGLTRTSFNFSFVKTENTTLPPTINAMEVYLVKQHSQSQTNENDVAAILNIKSTYGVKRDWQGDPCLPKSFMWDGLDCIIFDDSTIPPRIRSLDLSSNGLNGSVSSYFADLTFLETLDLSGNNLSGDIPDFLAQLPQLNVLNLSGNKFTGSVPQKLLDRTRSGLRLSGLDRAETTDQCEADKCKSSNKSNKLVIIVALPTTSVLIILAAFIVICRLRRRKHKVEKLGSFSNTNEGFLGTKNTVFSYADILKMTNNFHNVVGKGGFGTVYHGITSDHKEVAVKLLSRGSSQGYIEFQAEAQLLTRVHHRNLTCLVGYCYEGSHMALVYEYMAKGNLSERLSGFGDGSVLSWSARLQIALDAAQGLDYLHNGCKPPIIHRDVKSANILLNENSEGKLADFGLSRACLSNDGSFISTRVIGTPGYIDPEYHETRRLHTTSDIYSFGIVILQLITGRPVLTRTHDTQCYLLQWVVFFLARGDIEIIADEKLGGAYDVNSVWKALELAMACSSPASSERPTMAHVLTELAECLAAEKSRIAGGGGDDLLEVNSGILDAGIAAR